MTWFRPRQQAAALWRDHRLITIAVALSLVPRILAMLAFRPALFTPDSFAYLAEGAHPNLSQWHPSGYPLFLWVLSPFHALVLVTAVQHLLGVATAVGVYILLRRWGLPAWGATLAACPTLIDSRQVALESSILPDTSYALLLLAAVAAVLIRRDPGPVRPAPAQCAVAGGLLFGAAILRGNGAPEMLALLAVLAVCRAGARAIAAAAIAFTLPLLAYMGLFAAKYGNFALTNSDGMFLWSRTMSFADCSTIRPPAGLRMLCPDRQPNPPRPAGPWSVPALLGSPTPAAYLWSPGVWWRDDAHPGFNAANNGLALHFALDAIRAQPVSYARTVASGVLLTFLATDRTLNARQLHFTAVPDVARLDRSQRRHLENYGHVGSDTHPVEPWAYFLYLYQEPVYFPGIMFGAVLAAGLAGAIRRWRHGGGPPALPWAVAALGIVVPVAVHEYHYRYAISVIPVACLAAGLAFARHPGPVPQATSAPLLASAEPAPAPAGARRGPALAQAVPARRAAGSPAPRAVPPPRPGGPARGTAEADPRGRTGSVAGQAPEPEP
ncbi:MAG TPA: hypothetical protein VGY50_07070 [Streptosporangiaceae bacterium]|nr:hypothetical protein [Streptosporangiaceae bacterium]